MAFWIALLGLLCYLKIVEVYAKQLLYSIKANRNWSAALGSLRLLGQISRIIQNRLQDEYKGKQFSFDTKLKRIIDEKKQAHGLKQE